MLSARPFYTVNFLVLVQNGLFPFLLTLLHIVRVVMFQRGQGPGKGEVTINFYEGSFGLNEVMAGLLI